MADLPTGTVTFLFTDIEGSTTRWEQQRPAMQAALARHDAILREAITAHGGHVFKTVGDAFYAVFAMAPDAVEAALAAQQALRAEMWDAALGVLRVRMALHTGGAEERDGDYFGPPLNRVARLMSAGHGGQILLSLATHELVRDQLAGGIELRDLGEHRLKDLIRPEHVFQLVTPVLQDGFPPLKSLDLHPNNLPLQSTPLIGRAREAAAVRDRLLQPEVRVLTLSGPGGTGKTRLALQVAAELLEDFTDGAWFVNLAPVRDPAFVIPTIAQTLNVTEGSITPLLPQTPIRGEVTGATLIESLKNYLRQKSMLLLLDNFEQVLPAAPLVTNLLSAAPQLKVLVTSRALLGLYGEHDLVVPPLSLPDPKHLPPIQRLSQYEAVRLFIERAQAAKAGFAMTNENAPAVAEICARLDGLPLAIELAAARIRLLPPQELLQRLSSRLKLLTGGGRDLPARQQTLRGAIEWSYGLLDATEQTLFARLAAFVGGRTLEAIEAVCNAEGDLAVDVLDGVASLVDKSLLQQAEGPAGEARFVMLETIHEYARERLEASGEAEAARRRHAEYFLQVAEMAEPELAGPRQVVWLERLEAEHDNLRTALSWALEQREAELALRLAGRLAPFWETRGHVDEGRRWLEQAVNSTVVEGAMPTAASAWALYWLGSFQPIAQSGRAHIEKSLELFREYGDKRGIAWSLMRLAMRQREEGNTQTHRLVDESLALFSEIDDKSGIATALQFFSDQAFLRGDTSNGYTHLDQALALFREVGDRRGVAWIQTTLGLMALSESDYASAQAHYEEALALSREIGDTETAAHMLNNLGLLLLRRGDPAAAEERVEESIALLTKLGAEWAAANSKESLATIMLERGDVERALALLRECLTTFHDLRSNYGIAFSLERLAAAAMARQHNTDGARRAGRLLGAAAALRETSASPVPPWNRSEYDQLVAAASAPLDEAAWQTAWAEGHAMPLEQAIAHALEDTLGR